jgi:enamine deaminase RidA (YjgF/YER057c/UK114 family)
MATRGVHDALRSRGLTLPDPPAPVGAYQRARLFRGMGVLSGQFPMRNGVLAFAGRVGADLSEAQGREAAQLAALNVLAQIAAVLDGFDRLETLLRLEGYVASADGWMRQPVVLDGASELFAAALGDKGRHARAAIGVQRLPLDAPVELVMSFAARE